MIKLTTEKETTKETEATIIDLLLHKQFKQEEIKNFELHKWQKLATLTKKQGKESIRISLVFNELLVGKYFEYLKGGKITHTKAAIFPCLFTEKMESVFLELL